MGSRSAAALDKGNDRDAISAGATLLPTVLAILSGHVRGRRDTLYGHDLDHVEIVCDEPTALHADGEDLGDVVEAVFEAERGAVSVFV